MKKTMIKGNADWYLDVFKNFENQMNGQSKTRLHDIRKAAIQSFADLGYPTTKDEEWKYTNVSKIADLNFKPAGSVDLPVLQSDDVEKFLFSGLDVYLLVFVNGHFNPALSHYTDSEKNLTIRPLSQALASENPQVQKHLTAYAKHASESFTALNTAFIQDGTFIHIPAGKKIDKPVHLLYITHGVDEPLLHTPRNLIIADENSQARIIETYGSTGPYAYFSNVVTEILVQPNASLEHLKLQIESAASYHIGSIQVQQQRNSNFISHAFSFGSALNRNNINIVLEDEGCECTLNGLYVANDKQLVDNHTSIDHAKPHCNSHELYKGILDDKANGVFNGKIFVRRDAQKTNAIQSNNCVLLSDDAAIDTKPQLEIFADDVKCTHGATVGQLDEDAFFYMRARGLDERKARNLLIYAFASDVIDKIEIDALRESITEIFSEKLHTIKPV